MRLFLVRFCLKVHGARHSKEAQRNSRHHQAESTRTTTTNKCFCVLRFERINCVVGLVRQGLHAFVLSNVIIL
jgi:hypothetical protein